MDDDSTDEEGFVEGDSPEAVEAEQKAQSNDSESEPKDDDSSESKDSDAIAKAITDGFEKVLDVMSKNSEEKKANTADDTRKVSSMVMKTRATATDDQGTLEDPKTPDEVLDETQDTGENFEDTAEELSGMDGTEASPVGDNGEGSKEEPPYNTVEKASLASVMNLVDSYIKASVLPEKARFASIERFSTITKDAAKNQLRAAKAVGEAADKKIASITDKYEAKIASLEEALKAATAKTSAKKTAGTLEDETDEFKSWLADTHPDVDFDDLDADGQDALKQAYEDSLSDAKAETAARKARIARAQAKIIARRAANAKRIQASSAHFANARKPRASARFASQSSAVDESVALF
jgi:methylthioribose-1-phosphate isomerase